MADSGGGSAGAAQLVGPEQAKWHRQLPSETASVQHHLHPEWVGSADWWRVRRAGVLAKQEGKGHWAALKRAFRLLVDDVDDQDPADPAYVFSGHCPLTVSPPPGPLRLSWRASMCPPCDSDGMPGKAAPFREGCVEPKSWGYACWGSACPSREAWSAGAAGGGSCEGAGLGHP